MPEAVEDRAIESALARAGGPAAAHDVPAIQVRGIGRRHPSEDRWLFDDVSFALAFGERLGLVGPSGSGKTLLLRAMALLDVLDRGAVFWKGQAIRGIFVPAYRSRVVYLHQRPVLFEGSVEDNLRLPMGLRSHRGRVFDRRIALELLALLGRGQRFLEQSGPSLSGGEAQLVALVRALLLEPSVLLLDEPTASLDLATATAVEQVIASWLDERAGSRAYVWVSHDSGQVERMTGRQIKVKAGRIAPER
jgi:putative ABC transport system ATP-binding protein